MKIIIITIAISFFCFVANAQTEIKKTYYPSGKLATEEPYLNGKMNGIAKGYYESGKIKYETPVSNNNKQGIAKGYFENGNLEIEISYVDGKQDGVEKNYYDNGKIKSEETTKNGKKEGISKFYSETGTPVREITYVDGKWSGIAKDFYENGNLKTEALYFDDRMIGIETEYNEKGKVKPSKTPTLTCKCCNGKKGSYNTTSYESTATSTSVKTTFKDYHEGDMDYATGRVKTTTTSPKTYYFTTFTKCTCCDGKGKIPTEAASKANIKVNRTF